MPRAPIHRLRAICLALPEAEERQTWGEATFRVRGKIFAMHVAGGDSPAFWCKAPRGSQQILVGADPARFFVPPYLGHKGWIGVRLDHMPDWQEIAELVRRSHGLVAPKRLVLQPGPPRQAQRAARRVALAAVPLALLATPAAAQVAEAHYVVYQAGFRVMEARVTMDFGQRGYRMTADTRTTGFAMLFANSQMRLESEGRWIGHAVAPDRYSAVGSRNGQPRRIEIAYRGNQPDLLAQVPPDAGERIAVSPEQQRGTVDILSAMARLVREAGATGRCDGAISVYDGRRRLEWSARTETLGSQTARAGGLWTPVMRCSFSSRVVAGFRHVDDPNEIGRPRTGSAEIAQVRPDLPPLPVRVEFPYGFLGSLRAELVRVEDPRARRTDGSGE